MRKGSAVRLLFYSLCGLFVLGIFACSRDNMDYGPAFASAKTRGALVYERNCSPCHDAENLQLVKHPPKLTGLFHRQNLPSGAPATDEQVRKTIVGGRGIMPPFGQTLDQKQIDDLLQYLHKL